MELWQWFDLSRTFREAWAFAQKKITFKGFFMSFILVRLQYSLFHGYPMRDCHHVNGNAWMLVNCSHTLCRPSQGTRHAVLQKAENY